METDDTVSHIYFLYIMSSKHVLLAGNKAKTFVINKTDLFSAIPLKVNNQIISVVYKGMSPYLSYTGGFAQVLVSSLPPQSYNHNNS